MEDLQEEQSESFRLGQMADPLTLWDKAGEAQGKDSFGTSGYYSGTFLLQLESVPVIYFGP